MYTSEAISQSLGVEDMDTHFIRVIHVGLKTIRIIISLLLYVLGFFNTTKDSCLHNYLKPMPTYKQI